MASSTTREPAKKAPSAKAKPVEEEQGAQIAIDNIAVEKLLVPIVGTSPLIVHRFGEKAKREMLDKMQARKTPKEPKDPQAEYESCFYWIKNEKNGTPGFPIGGFHQATVGAARFYGKDVTMTGLRQFMFMRGEPGTDGISLAAIKGSEPFMREDYVRVGQGGTDLRYRPQFDEWSTTLTVLYVKSALTRNSVLSLIDAGGLGVGVGEWRPEKKGDFGTYTVDLTRDVEVVPS